MARRRREYEPMPKEVLATFAQNRRLNEALRRAGLPKLRDLGALLRRAACGDGEAAQWLDDRYPAWRDFAERASVADEANVSTDDPATGGRAGQKDTGIGVENGFKNAV